MYNNIIHSKIQKKIDLSYDNKNTEVNKCVLSFSLKTSTNLAHLTSNGKGSQSLRAAQMKDLSQVLLWI